MVSSEVKKILEYKCHSNTDYLFVLWQDNTKSWTRMTSLKCKDMVCAFFKSAVKVLKDEEKAMLEEQRKKKEEMLLKKIISNNMEESVRAEKKQANAILELLERQAKPAQKTTMPFAGIKKHTAFSTDPFFFSKPSPNIERKQQPIKTSPHETMQPSYQSSEVKRHETCKVKHNTLLVKISSDFTVNLIFFFKNTAQPTVVASKDVIKLPTNTLIPYLHSVFPSQTPDTVILTVSNPEDRSVMKLEDILKSRKEAMICKATDSFWIVAHREDIENRFGLQFRCRLILFRIARSAYLERLFLVGEFIQPESLWLQNTFRFGVSALTDFVGRNLTLPPSKSVYILGDLRLASMIHASILAQRSSRIVDNIENANTVLIQGTYLKFLHHVPGFYKSLYGYTKFFVISNKLHTEEILPSGGMITFTNEFIQSCELLSVSKLVEVLNIKKSWSIKVKVSTYLCLKKRLESQNTMPEYLPKMKAIHTMFRNNIVESFEGDLREHLEKTNYRTRRHFLEVSSVKLENLQITIEEVTKLVLAS